MRVLFISLAMSLGVMGLAQESAQGVRLLSNMPLASFINAPTSGAACYGYTSPAGKEYAIFCHRQGVSFVNITNPTSPAIVGEVAFQPSLWHEAVVLGNYCYAVTDQVGNGVHIIDLNNIDQGVVTEVGIYTGGGVSTVHTIEANPVTNSIYLNGANIAGGGFVALSAANPTQLVETGRWSTRYVHDSVIKSFTTGPNAGKEIAYLCCGRNGLYTVDITNHAAMVTKDFVNYIASTNKYTHSGALTADGNYFLINDEFDEGNALVNTCTTHVINVSNISNITTAGSFTNNGSFIDHNSNMVGNTLFLSAYKGGMRIYNASNPLAMTEIGYFDSYVGSGFAYDGAWGVYAYYPSGNAIISDMTNGLWVVDPSEAVGLGAPITQVTLPSASTGTASVANLRKLDSSVGTLSSHPKRRVDPRQASMDVQYTSSVTPATAIDLDFRGTAVSSATNVSVQLKNVSTGVYSTVGTAVFSPASGTLTVTNIPAGPYRSATGLIEARVLVSHAKKVASVSLDLAKLTVRR